MLHEFLVVNRQALISSCRDKVAKRFLPGSVPDALDHGVPLFLQQLADILRTEQSTVKRHASASVPATSSSKISRAASLHGTDLLGLGYTLDQVVHDYGDLCQAITEMAVAQAEPISNNEFRTLNRCLDDAIADAVTSFANGHQILVSGHIATLQDRLQAFMDEHVRLIEIAIKSNDAIRSGFVGSSGATGTLLAHALAELRALSERLVNEDRRPPIAAGAPASRRPERGHPPGVIGGDKAAGDRTRS